VGLVSEWSISLIIQWPTVTGSIFDRIRIIPSGHSHPLTLPSVSSEAPPEMTTTTSRYAPLEDNPYLPFWPVWKPSTNWSRNSWDRGSVQGLQNQPPDFWVAVVECVWSGSSWKRKGGDDALMGSGYYLFIAVQGPPRFPP
jgi:hypothetical protein